MHENYSKAVGKGHTEHSMKTANVWWNRKVFY